MNYLSWCQNSLKNKNVQELLEEKIKKLVPSYFDENDEYAIEKFIKSFCEGLRYLESTLLYQRGIHPEQLKKDYRKDNVIKYQEVEAIMIREVNRQAQHYETFLSAVRK